MKILIATLALLVVTAAGGDFDMEFETVQIPDNSSFQDENFSEELYSLIPGWGEAALVFDIESWEYYTVNYIYADAVLTREGHGTEGLITILIPGVPISKEKALEYGTILSRGVVPEPFSRDGNELVHEEEFSRLIMELDEAGMITGVRFLEWSP